MLRLAKDSAVKSRTQAINQLKAVLVSADAGLRDWDHTHVPSVEQPAVEALLSMYNTGRQ
jgi:hypothetical protein